ncbi:PAS domain-containing protein, partial [Xanthomonas sp. SHU 199]|uniref:PAS domain-containing protein n=1 Tax=Xanthomonas sp. SHU 199 TaxID=1591174 RepID=UPI0003811979
MPSDISVEAARTAAARSELDLLLCLQYAPEGVLIVDPQARVVAFNHTAEALWNRPRAQVLGRPLGELADADVRDDFLAHCLHDGGSGSYELLLRDYDGAARWLAVSAARAPQHYSQLQVLFVRDISAERARDARMRLLSLALDSSDAAIVVCDPELNILYVNAGFSQVFGYAESEVLGHLPSNVLAGPGTDMQTVQHTRERVRAGFGHQTDILAYRKDGTPLWATLVATPIASEDGSQQHYILSFTDITQSKMHEVLHKNVLDALVREQPLIEVATLICKEVERIAPELMAAIVSVDGSGCLQPLG